MIQDNIRSYVDVMNGEELAKQLLAEVRRDVEIKVADNDTHVKLEEIRKILEGIDRNLTKEINDLTQTVERTASGTKRGPGTGGSTAAPTKLTNNVGTLNATLAKTNIAINGLNKSMNNSIDMLARAMRAVGRSGGSGGGGGAGTVAAAASGAASFRRGGGGGGGGGRRGGGGGAAPSGGAAANFGKTNAALAGTNAVLSQGISMFEGGLENMGVHYKKSFQGILTQGTEHVQDMRAFLYTTQGAGVAMTDLEKASIQLNNVASETGRTWGEGATFYRKEMAKGLTTEVIAGKIHTRTAQDAMRLTKNSMRTANMIGASAEGTAELFSEWNRHLGMTNEQLGFVGREMEQIAKNSGVTGDDLLAATKAASVLVKEVRNFSGISQQAMSQIIQTQTSLQKFGAEDVGAKFNQAMSQGVRTLSQAEPVIASIIAESAQRAGVSMTGSMLTGGSQQRKMQKEVMKTLEGRLSSIGMGGVDPAQLLDRLEEMRDAGQDTGMIEQQIKNVTGMGAGELQNLYKSYQEASMSFGDRMKGFEDRIANATTAEGRALAQRQKDDFAVADQRQQLSTFSDMLGKKGDVNKALEQFNQRMVREGRGDATLSGPDAARQLVQRGVGGLADRAKSSGVDLNAALKKRGMTREGLERGLLDPKSAKEFGAILQEVENEVMTQEKANQDPVLKANLALAKINEALTGAVTKLYMAFASFELIMGTAVALMAAKAGMGLSSLANLSSLMPGKLGRLGKVGGKAGGGVASAAAGRGGASAFRVGGTAASRMAGGVGGRAAAGVGGKAAAGVAAKGVGGLLTNVISKIGVKAIAGAGVKAGAAGLNAALGASTGGLSLLVTALLGGFIGAMDAAANATKIFNKKQEELTYTNIAAAKTAGFVTGMFDFITFGLFDQWIGPTGTWTIALAEFFDNFWPLAVAFDIAIKPLEVIWGLLKGIWFFAEEVFSGIWEGVKAVWEPIKPVFEEIKSAFNGLLGPGGETIDVVKVISESLKWFGKQVGSVFKFIGQTIGAALKMVLPVIKAVGAFFMDIIVPAFNILWTYLKGVWDVLSGIFTLDGDKIMKGLTSIFEDVPNMIGDALSSAWTWITEKLPKYLETAWDWMKVNVPKYLAAAWDWVKVNVPKYLAAAWDWLKNNGPKILLGVLAGVALWFGGLPVLLAPLLYKAFVWIVNNVPKLLSDAFIWIVQNVPKFLWDGFVWLVTNIPVLLYEGFMWIVTGVGEMLSQGFSWLVNDLPTIIKDGFMSALQGVWDWIKSWIPGGETVAGVAEGAGNTWDELKQGHLLGAAKEAGKTVLNTGANLTNGVTNNALTRAIGIDFELFDIGSMGINNDGLAYLHKGEMVIPPEDAAQLQGKATSSGAFSGSGFFGGIAKGMSSALGLGLFDNKQGSEAMGGGTDSWLSGLMAPMDSLFGGLFGSTGGTQSSGGAPKQASPTEQLVEGQKETNRILGEAAKMLNTGLFESNTVSDAMYESAMQSNKEFESMFASESTGPLIIEAQEVLMGEAGPLDAGLFAPDQASEALGSGGGIMGSLQSVWEDISGRVERAVSNPVDAGLFAASQAKETFDAAMSSSPIDSLMNMFGFGGGSKPTAGAGSSLYYNKEAEYQQATTQTSGSGGTTNNYVNQGRRVRGMPVKGGINTNMLSSSGDIEEYITTSRLLNEAAGSSGGGGMASAMLERIVDALEGGRLDEIILLLTAIRDKSTNVMVNTGGGGEGGAPSVEKSGLGDGYNKAWLNGDWTHLGDPSFSDNANILGTSR